MSVTKRWRFGTLCKELWIDGEERSKKEKCFDFGGGQFNDSEEAMSLQMLGLLNAHILRICHGNKTVSMMHLHTARERLSGIADLCQVLDAGNISKV
jgi:hypothetical protein